MVLPSTAFAISALLPGPFSLFSLHGSLVDDVSHASIKLGQTITHYDDVQHLRSEDLPSAERMEIRGFMPWCSSIFATSYTRSATLSVARSNSISFRAIIPHLLTMRELGSK